MKRTNRISIMLASSLIFAFACKAKKSTEEKVVKAEVVSTCSGDYTYTNDVKAILDKHCASSCHSAAKSAGGYDLSNYSKLTSGQLKMRLIGTVKHLENFTAMPLKNPKLSDSTIQVLDCWVKAGMPE